MIVGETLDDNTNVRIIDNPKTSMERVTSRDRNSTNSSFLSNVKKIVIMRSTLF